MAVAAAAKRPARGWRCPLEFHYAPVDFLASVPDSHAAGGGTWGTWSRCCWRTIDAVVLPFLPSFLSFLLLSPACLSSHLSAPRSTASSQSPLSPRFHLVISPPSSLLRPVFLFWRAGLPPFAFRVLDRSVAVFGYGLDRPQQGDPFCYGCHGPRIGTPYVVRP